MNPFYNTKKEDDSDSNVEDDADIRSVDSEKEVKKSKRTGKKEKSSKSKKSEKKSSSNKKAKKEAIASESSDSETETRVEKKKITDEDRQAYFGQFVDNDKKVVRKLMGAFKLYVDKEISEGKFIEKTIKISGFDGAKPILNGIESVFTDKKAAAALVKANEAYNWPNTNLSIEDQLKEVSEDNDDEATKRLVSDYNDVRKSGLRLKKKVVSVLKKLDNKSADYKRIREMKKKMDALQDECDRCIDESDLDPEELGELILQYSEAINELVKYMSSSLQEKDSDDSDAAPKKHKKIRMPKFDDEDDDNSERDRVRIRNRKAVYKTIIKDQNGKLSSSHIVLEPRAQAGIPLPVNKGDVIGVCWKEETGSRMLFRSILSMSNRDNDAIEVVPLQVRISEYHMIYEVPENGVLRLGWDNGLSLRKSKELDVFVKRFNPSAYTEVMEAEKKRREAWRLVEKSDLTEGNIEGGKLTLKLVARVMTEDGVKYTCHCDWEGLGGSLKAQWDVQYPYKVWFEWYQNLLAKYPDRIRVMAPFSGTAFMTTKAVVDERLYKINNFFQDLVLDGFMMDTPEVVSWFKCQENIRIAKRRYYEKYKVERERNQKQEEVETKQEEPVAAVDEDALFDPLSYLAS